jgi:hypothetical protein
MYAAVQQSSTSEYKYSSTLRKPDPSHMRLTHSRACPPTVGLRVTHSITVLVSSSLTDCK